MRRRCDRRALAARRGRAHRRGGVTVKPFDAHAAAGLGTHGLAARLRHAQSACLPGRAASSTRSAQPIDGGGPLPQGEQRGLDRARAAAADAAPAHRARPCKTGVRVIDLFTPLCAGQRIGIFAGSGIGKSTLLAMLARSHGLRHRRHRAGRRARPRGARVHGGCARQRPRARRRRRRHRRREPDDAPAGAEDRDDASPSTSATAARTCC